MSKPTKSQVALFMLRAIGIFSISMPTAWWLKLCFALFIAGTWHDGEV